MHSPSSPLPTILLWYRECPWTVANQLSELSNHVSDAPTKLKSYSCIRSSSSLILFTKLLVFVKVPSSFVQAHIIFSLCVMGLQWDSARLLALILGTSVTLPTLTTVVPSDPCLLPGMASFVLSPPLLRLKVPSTFCPFSPPTELHHPHLGVVHPCFRDCIWPKSHPVL